MKKKFLKLPLLLLLLIAFATNSSWAESNVALISNQLINNDQPETPHQSLNSFSLSYGQSNFTFDHHELSDAPSFTSFDETNHFTQHAISFSLNHESPLLGNFSLTTQLSAAFLTGSDEGSFNVDQNVAASVAYTESLSGYQVGPGIGINYNAEFSNLRIQPFISIQLLYQATDDKLSYQKVQQTSPSSATTSATLPTNTDENNSAPNNETTPAATTSPATTAPVKPITPVTTSTVLDETNILSTTHSYLSVASIGISIIDDKLNLMSFFDLQASKHFSKNIATTGMYNGQDINITRNGNTDNAEFSINIGMGILF